MDRTSRSSSRSQPATTLLSPRARRAALIGQLKEVYFEGELDLVDTAIWFTKIARKDYAIGLNTTGNGLDDPDQPYFEHFACKSERNYTGYCNPEIEKLFPVQSPRARHREAQEDRVGDRPRAPRGRRAAGDHVEPPRRAAWHPYVKGFKPDGQQPLQWLALRGCLAGSLMLLKSLPRMTGEEKMGRVRSQKASEGFFA